MSSCCAAKDEGCTAGEIWPGLIKLRESLSRVFVKSLFRVSGVNLCAAVIPPSRGLLW